MGSIFRHAENICHSIVDHKEREEEKVGIRLNWPLTLTTLYITSTAGN